MRRFFLTVSVLCGVMLGNMSLATQAHAADWEHVSDSLFTPVMSSDFPSYVRTVEVGSTNYVVFRGNNIERLYLGTNTDDTGDTWSVQQISSQGGLNPAVVTDGNGKFYIVHATADATTTLGTGYALLLTTNASGSWVTSEIEGSDDMWYPQAFMDNSGTVHIWADSTRSTVSDFYTFSYVPSTQTMTGPSTLATGNTSCDTISTARWSTSAVFSSTNNAGYVFTQCTFVGSGQGLYVSIYNANTTSWSIDRLQDDLGSYRAGDAPTAFIDNGIVGVFHAMDVTDEVYVSYLSNGSWTHQSVMSQFIPGQMDAVVTDDAIMLSVGSSGNLHLWTCTKPSSGSVSCTDAEIDWEADSNGNPYTPSVVDNNIFMLANGDPAIAFLDDGTYDLVIGKPGTVAVEKTVVAVTGLETTSKKLTWDQVDTAGAKYQVAIYKGKTLVKKYKYQKKNSVSLSDLAKVIRQEKIGRKKLRLAVRVKADDTVSAWKKTEVSKKVYNKYFSNN